MKIVKMKVKFKNVIQFIKSVQWLYYPSIQRHTVHCNEY